MRNLKLFLALCLVILVTTMSISQSVGDFRSKTSGLWSEVDTWERFDGTSWVSPAPYTPTSADGIITILNGHVITISTALTVDQVVINSGGEVIINNVTLTVSDGDGIDIMVNGILELSGTSGSLTISTGANVTIGNGGLYQHNRNGGNIPLMTWLAGSTCEVIGLTNGTSINANGNVFYNLIWNCPGQTTSVNWNNTLTTVNGDLSIVNSNNQQVRFSNASGYTLNVGGNIAISGSSYFTTSGTSQTFTVTVNVGGSVIISGGTFSLSNNSGITGIINVMGNFNISGGLVRTSNSSSVINFVGSGLHYYTKSGGELGNTSNTIRWTFTVVSPSILRMGTSVLDGYPNFTLNAGATLESGHASGLNGNFATTGTVTLNTSANYTFNGASAQVTGSLLPATVNNLTINNNAGVTLSGNVTVNGTLAIGGGTFNTGTNTVTINGTVQLNDGGWATGQDFVYNSGSTLVFNTTSQYGVASNHVYWPWTNGPTNVSVVGSGGIKLNAWRPVNGLFQTWAGVEIPTGEKLIANGQVRINTGGYFANQGPEYGSSSKLIYASGSGGYNTWLEWPSVNGPPNVEVINGTPVTLSESKSISGTLDLTDGKILLGNYNLTVGSIGASSASSYVVTNGSGALVRNVGNTNVLFPVGTSTTYNPLIINNAGTADNFSVRVKSTFDNPPVDPNKVVNRQWTINEAVAGGSDATITFQWNGADETAGFDRLGDIEIGRWTGTQWQGYAAVYQGGSDPYTAYIGNVTQFSDFSIGNKGALPIQLASFIGNVIATGRVKLEWQTISEIDNLGFYVEKFNEAANAFVTVSELIPGAGTTLQPQTYSWIDENAVETNLQYRLKQVDMNGLANYFGPIMLNPTGVIDNSVPAVFALHQNYPNPFNPTTTIKFSLAEANYTTLKVYDLLGSEVATLYAGEAEAGKLYTVKFDGSGLSSGIYLYKLQSGKNVETRKLMLVK